MHRTQYSSTRCAATASSLLLNTVSNSYRYPGDSQFQSQIAEDLGLFDDPEDMFTCGICKEAIRDGQKICKLQNCGCVFHFQNTKQVRVVALHHTLLSLHHLSPQSLDQASKQNKSTDGVRVH
jgi:hypothetical protein